MEIRNHFFMDVNLYIFTYRSTSIYMFIFLDTLASLLEYIKVNNTIHYKVLKIVGEYSGATRVQEEKSKI